MKMGPFGFEIPSSVLNEDCWDRHITRRLSDLKGQFSDADAYRRLLDQEDRLAYEVYELLRPEREGELLSGLSVLHPGLVGAEYFITKGHYHAVRETAEIYICLQGKGLLLMENEQGQWAAEELCPGRGVYVAPGWAHRSVNTSLTERLITFFIYPAHAGHDYATIESTGFRKLVVCREGAPVIIDNPSWQEALVGEGK